MRRDALALLAVCVGSSALWLACTRVNERYCEADTDCPRDQTCNVKAKQCQSSSVGDMAMSVVDIAGRADFSDPPDSATPDLTPPPPECTKDSECAAKGAAAPACVANKCAPCTRNYQCPDAACVPAGSVGAGSCVAKSRMLYVDNNAGKCDAAGAMDKPYCLVDQALANVVPGAKDVILLRASADDYQNDGNPLIITTSVRIVGERADRSSKAPSFTDPVQVYPGMGGPDVQFVMEDLSATVKRAGDSTALYCYRKMGDAAGAVTLRWMRYESNPIAVVRVDGCNDTTITNSVIVRNDTSAASAYAAVHVLGGNVKIANTVIARNTPPNSTAGGGLFLGEAGSAKLGTIDLAFNTIADNTCKTSGGTPACNFHSDVAAIMNYSIVTGANSLLSSARITLNNSVTPTGYSGGGSGNVTSSGTVPKFVNSAANTADYHLTTDAANDVLRLTNISPSERSDIDSDPRPSADGKVDVGADQRVP